MRKLTLLGLIVSTSSPGVAAKVVSLTLATAFFCAAAMFSPTAFGQVQENESDSKLSFESSFATVANDADERSLAQAVGDAWIRKEVEEGLREEELTSRGEEFVPQDISVAFSDSTLVDVRNHVELVIADLSHAMGTREWTRRHN